MPKLSKVDRDDLDIGELKELKQDKKNARKHTARNIGMIENSLRQVGAARSGVIDENGVILAGNGTYEALVNAGIDRVKIVEANGNEWVVVQRKGLTEEQKRILSVSDNRAAELAEWDWAELGAQGIDLQPWFGEEELNKISKVTDLEAPKMAWVLLGIPVTDFGDISDAVDRLSKLPGVVCETVLNDGDEQD